MSNTNEKYNTLKLRRGKRKNDELNRLSSSDQDFDYRRLYIEERELDLHVFNSRRLVSNWVSYSFLGLGVWYYQYPELALTLIVLALAAKWVSVRYQKMFNRVNGIYNRVLNIVNSAIMKEYGISFS